MQRIETSGIRKVVQQIDQEAEATLFELGLSPVQRMRRKDEPKASLALDGPRRTRRTLEFTTPRATGTRRRSRGATNL